MKLISLYLLFFTITHLVETKDIATVNMLLSFLFYQSKPISLLIPNLCWNNYELRILIEAASKVGIRVGNSMEVVPGSQNRYQEMVILADLTCPNISTFLYSANTEGYFKAPYRWMILQDISRNGFDMLDELDILPDSNVVVANKIPDGYELIEVYKISSTSPLIKMIRQFWQGTPVNESKECNKKIIVDMNVTQRNTSKKHETNELMYPTDSTHDGIVLTTYGRKVLYCNSLRTIDSRPLAIKRKNLRRHKLTMSLVITDSNETKHHLSDRLQLHQDSISKMTYTVISVCFKMLNATENVIFASTWGYPDKNGQWNGMINHLVQKEADLGTLSIFTKARIPYIDYIAMIGTTAVRFVFREPPLSNVSNIFILPFTTGVWLAIFVCLLASAAFLYIISKWESTVSMHPLQLDGSLTDVLLLITGAVLQQGCTLEPRYGAGRCVMLLLFMSLTILYAAYSANIVVLLRAPSPSIRTAQDLLHSPMVLGASDFDYNKYFLKQLKDPLRKTIYEKKIVPKGKKPHFYSMREGVEKIRKGLFAFHMELNPGYRLVQETYHEDEKCDLVEINFINEFDPWLPGQKRGPYKDLFKTSFMKIRESGIQNAIHKRLHVPKPKCSGSVVAFSSVGVVDMYPALVLTLYGFVAAVVVLILEICHWRLLTVRRRMKMRIKNQLDGCIEKWDSRLQNNNYANY